MKKLVCLFAGISLLAGTMVSAGTVGVDWGGLYGNSFSSTLNQGLGSVTTALEDFTFDSVSDAAYILAFGSVFTPSADSRYLAPAGKTGPLYTGLQLVNHSTNAVPNDGGIYRWSAATTPNQLNKTNPTNGGSDPMSMSVAYFAQKADFLNGLDAADSVGFSDEAGGASVTLSNLRNRNNGAATIAFVVQEGSSWYATIATNRATSGADWSGTLSVNPYTADWVAFDPSTNQFLNVTNLGAAKAGSTFEDITAFGVSGQILGYDGTIANTEKLDFTAFAGSFTEILPLPTEAAIDFGGDYASAANNSGKTVTESNGDFDFDGNANDRASSVSFGQLFTPPNNTNVWTDIPGKSNGDIYHGISVAIFSNQVINPGVSMDRIGDNAAGDRFQMGNTKITDETLSLAVAVYWNAADFLNGGTAAPLGNETNSLSVNLASGGIKPLVHFLVQAGGSWYISADAGWVSFGINGATANWYAFDPTANAMFWDESNPGAAVTGSSLGDITAAGVYGQTDNGHVGATGSLFGMDGLQVLLEADAIAALAYDDWLSDYNVGSLTNLTDDFDGDLMDNLVEYGLGGDPTTNDAAEILPVYVLESSVMTYIYNRRVDADDRGLIYTVGKDTDLVSTPDGWATNGVTEVGYGAIDLEFESVTNTAPVDVDAKFLRLQIELAE